MTQYLKDAPDHIGWIITHGNGEGYWLVGVKDEKIVTSDGPHYKPRGVAKALELYKQLGFFKPDVTYMMVFIGEIPNVKTRINHKAVKACREMMELAG